MLSTVDRALRTKLEAEFFNFKRRYFGRRQVRGQNDCNVVRDTK
jgi:hypothetical protein